MKRRTLLQVLAGLLVTPLSLVASPKRMERTLSLEDILRKSAEDEIKRTVRRIEDSFSRGNNWNHEQYTICFALQTVYPAGILNVGILADHVQRLNASAGPYRNPIKVILIRERFGDCVHLVSEPRTIDADFTTKHLETYARYDSSRPRYGYLAGKGYWLRRGPA